MAVTRTFTVTISSDHDNGFDGPANVWPGATEFELGSWVQFVVETACTKASMHVAVAVAASSSVSPDRA